jgi:hypothetical protein
LIENGFVRVRRNGKVLRIYKLIFMRSKRITNGHVKTTAQWTQI